MKKSVRRAVFLLSFIVSVTLSGVSANAQYISDMPEDWPVVRKGADFYANGEILTPEQLGSLLSYTDGITLSQVEQYQKGFRTGKGLLIGFGSLTGAGLLTLGVGAVGVFVEAIALGIGVSLFAPLYAVSGDSPDASLNSGFIYVTYAGLAAAGVGVLGLAAGTAVYCVYKKRLNRVADSVNASREVRLSFGVQKYGAGLALNF